MLIDEPGLYMERDIDNKGRVNDTYYVVVALPTQLCKLLCTETEAMTFAKRLADKDEPWAIVAELYAIAELERMDAESDTYDQAEIVDKECSFVAGMRGKTIGERVAARKALLAQLKGTPAPIDRAALKAEAATLRARLAEIEASLATGVEA